MTLSELLAELYDDLGFQSAPSAAVIARLTRRLNRAHEALLSEPGCAGLRYGSMTLASVASRARYGLSNVAEVRAVLDATNDCALIARFPSWYRGTNPDPANNEGTPLWYIPLGIVAVAQVPASTGTGLWIVSSSASDTVPTVTVDAVRVGGYPHSPSPATVNGVTRVAIGGGSALTDYIDVTQFQLSAACVGDISLYDAAAAGNLLAVIPRGQTTSRYYGFYLSPTPSAAITYTIDVECELLPLVNATDEPRFNHKFHRILGIKARMQEYEKDGDARYSAAKDQYAAELAKLKYALHPTDFVMVPGGQRDSGSNLGPYFPSGRF